MTEQERQQPGEAEESDGSDVEEPEQPGDTESASSGWRDDPLSLFLLGAAVVLAGMYAWDESQRSRLVRQSEIAAQVDSDFAVDGVRCTVGSAGMRGEQLVFSCSRGDVASVAKLASHVDVVGRHAESFDSVIFRVGNAQLACPAEPGSWPDDCE